MTFADSDDLPDQLRRGVARARADRMQRAAHRLGVDTAQLDELAFLAWGCSYSSEYTNRFDTLSEAFDVLLDDDSTDEQVNDLDACVEIEVLESMYEELAALPRLQLDPGPAARQARNPTHATPAPTQRRN